MASLTPTDRTTLKRQPGRGSHDLDPILAILDEAFVCHVGVALDGHSYVIPMAYGREGQRLYLHGSTANRMLRSLQKGVETCVTVTLIDGLVLARSAFHHSVNYRCVMIFGTATEVVDQAEKLAALRALIEHVVPGRWKDVREPTESELRRVLVLSLPIQEASAKIRTGGPIEEEEDHALGIWAGVIPLGVKAGPPQADDYVSSSLVAPAYATAYRRPSE